MTDNNVTNAGRQQSPLLRLGTRESPLAMAQAHEARARLCAAHGWDEQAVELVPVKASGDKILNRPLAEVGGKALWTKELDQWLAEGRIDAAVHSMKDVETIRPDALTIAAILPRADRRDALIGANSIADIPQGATVGTSAPRRAAQLLYKRPDCKVVMFRGNVATRLGKLEAGEADVTFLAAAGLDRLGRSDLGARLAVEDWIPAAAQGAIGIECLADNVQARQWLDAINQPEDYADVMAERTLLAGLGGTCHSPVAAMCMSDGAGHGVIRAALFSGDGAQMAQGEVRFERGDDGAITALAKDLLNRASPEIRQNFGTV